MAKPSTRRSLFSAAAAITLGSGIAAGAAASVADLAEPAPPSPIMTAGRELPALWARYDAADWRDDLPGSRAAYAAMRDTAERIMAMTPTTLPECAVVLLLALSEIDAGQSSDDGFDTIDNAQRIGERITCRLFDLAGLDPLDYGAKFFMRESERVAFLERQS